MEFLLDASESESLRIPDGFNAEGASYARIDDDLVLTAENGDRLIITGYFDQGEPPTLTLPNGAAISGDQVVAIAETTTPEDAQSVTAADSRPAATPLPDQPSTPPARANDAGSEAPALPDAAVADLSPVQGNRLDFLQSQFGAGLDSADLAGIGASDPDFSDPGADTAVIAVPRFARSGQPGDRQVSDSVGRNGDFEDFAATAPPVEDQPLVRRTVEPQAVLNGRFSIQTLDGDNGFTITGARNGDLFGHSVSGAGDVNGDGLGDIVVGAPGVASESGGESGEAYVVLGSPEPRSAVLFAGDIDGADGFVIQAKGPRDGLGHVVAGGGDINGDGLDDIALGAPAAALSGIGNGNDGLIFVVFGTTEHAAGRFDLDTLDGTNGFTAQSNITTLELGNTLHIAGDLNGDGFDDLVTGDEDAPGRHTSIVDGTEIQAVVGSAGQSVVVFGDSDISRISGFLFNGGLPYENSGQSVGGAGDLNGDGFDDLVIGTSGGAVPFGNGYLHGYGQAYVIFGGTDAFADGLDLPEIDGNNGFLIAGIRLYDNTVSVSGIGDVNGDGIDDLIMANANPDAIEQGADEAFVIFGRAAGFGMVVDLADLDGNNGFVVRDGRDTQATGYAVAGTGDINGDGLDDIVLSSSVRGQGEKVFVIYGTDSGFPAALQLDQLDGQNGFVVADVDGRASIDIAGDLNGDGFDDIVIGTRRVGVLTEDQSGSASQPESGSAHIIFGGERLTEALLVEGTAAAEILIGGSGDDTLFGGGGSDILRGGEGNDLLIIGDGRFATVDGGLGVDALVPADSFVVNLAALPDDGIADLEVISLDLGFANHIIVDKQAVAAAARENGVLIISGGTEDAVSSTDIWAERLIGREIDNRDFSIFDNDGAVLAVENTIDSRGIIKFDTSFDLSELDGGNGFAVTANGPDQRQGAALSEIGDFNGDGIDDLVIGSPYGESSDIPDPSQATGQAILVFGDGHGFDGGFDPGFDADQLDGRDGVVLDGPAPGSRFGQSVGGAGDFNNDGIQDLIIGAPGASGGSDNGQAFVVFGDLIADADVIDLAALDGNNGFRLTGPGAMGTVGGTVGATVGFAGDLNGDGVDDVIVGAPGSTILVEGEIRQAESFVLFGGEQGFAAETNIAAIDGVNGFAMSHGGLAFDRIGDFNGDGIDDLLASDAAGSSPQSSRAFVLFGDPAGFDPFIDLVSLDNTQGFGIPSVEALDNLGAAVAGAGDVNGDGLADILIGAPRGDPLGLANAGETYVVFGTAAPIAGELALGSLDGVNGFSIGGISSFDQSGHAISSAGDFNGDGFDDILIGARGAAVGAENTGEVYLLFGSSAPFAAFFDLADINGLNGIAIAGLAAEDLLGEAVSAAGDINDDGFDDILIGANPLGSVKSYVIFGRAGTPVIDTASGDPRDGSDGGGSSDSGFEDTFQIPAPPPGFESTEPPIIIVEAGNPAGTGIG